jgi:hypothetical protein
VDPRRQKGSLKERLPTYKRVALSNMRLLEELTIGVQVDTKSRFGMSPSDYVRRLTKS